LGKLKDYINVKQQKAKRLITQSSHKKISNVEQSINKIPLRLDCRLPAHQTGASSPICMGQHLIIDNLSIAVEKNPSKVGKK